MNRRFRLSFGVFLEALSLSVDLKKSTTEQLSALARRASSEIVKRSIPASNDNSRYSSTEHNRAHQLNEAGSDYCHMGSSSDM